MSRFQTEQEQFWAESFGESYIERNHGRELLASNISFFSTALRQVEPIRSCIEFGANIGMNLEAIKLLYPHINLAAIEINKVASDQLENVVRTENIFNGSILEYPVEKQFDLVLIKGVLIHINPESLPIIYDKLYRSTEKYILIAEYYNPSPVAIPYRGHENKLFKRDFAGELLDAYSDLRLIDYGFVYKRDPNFPQDDITWFLLAKS